MAADDDLYGPPVPQPARRSLLDSDNPVLSLLGGIFSGNRIDPNADINSPVQQRTAIDSLLAAGGTIAAAGGARFGPQPTLVQGLTQGLMAGTMAGQAAQEHAQTLQQTQQVLAQASADAEVRRRLMERLIRNGDIAASLITGELGARQQPAAAPAGAPSTGTAGDGVREALKKREQGRDGYMSVNGDGFSGAYQIGSQLAGDAGFYKPPDGGEGQNGWGGRFNIPGFANVQTREDFLRNPAAQDQAYSLAMAHNDKMLQERGIYDRALAKGTINGVPITRDGLLAGAWIGGVQGLERWVDSDGKVNATDRNRTSVGDYVRLGAGGAAQPAGAPGARPAAATAAAPFTSVFGTDAPGVEIPAPGAAPAQAGSGGDKIGSVLDRYPGSSQLAANYGGATASDVAGGASGPVLPAASGASPFDTANIPLPAAASAPAAPAVAAAAPAPAGPQALPPAPQRMLQRATTAQLAGVLLSKDPTKALLDLANQKAERTTGVDPEGNAREAILDNNGNIVGWGVRKPFAGHTVKRVDPATGMVNEYRLNDRGEVTGEPIGQMKPDYRYQTEVIDGQTWHTERVPGTDIMRKLAPAPRDIKQVKEWDDATKRTLIWNLDANGNKQGQPFVSNEVPTHIEVAGGPTGRQQAYIYPGQAPVPVAAAPLPAELSPKSPERAAQEYRQAHPYTPEEQQYREALGKREAALFEAGQRAPTVRNQVNAFLALQNNLNSGVAAEALGPAGRWLDTLHLGDQSGIPGLGRDAAIKQPAMMAIRQQLVQQMMSGADGFGHNQISDADLRTLQGANLSIGNDPEANKIMASLMTRFLDKQEAAATAWAEKQEAAEQAGQPRPRFDAWVLREWKKDPRNADILPTVATAAQSRELPPGTVYRRKGDPKIYIIDEAQ